MQPDRRRGPGFSEPPGSVPDSGNGRINDLHLARQLARLGSPRRYGEYKAGRETVLCTPNYFKCGRFRGNPSPKNPILSKRKVIRMAVCREPFSLVLGRDAQKMAASSSPSDLSLTNIEVLRVCVRACYLVVGGRHFSQSPLE